MRANLSITPTEIQKRVLSCPAHEILYGGSVGGGKSCLAVMLAYVLCLNNPGIKIGIFRRSLIELEETILLEIYKIYPSNVYKYKTSKRKVEFRNGSVITLNFVENDRDLLQYQGQAFEVIIIDEAVNLTEHQIVYLKSRLRTTKDGFRTKFVCLTNPIGASRGYFKRRFIDNKQPLQIYEAPETKLKKDSEKRYLCFIPAKLQDNPFLMENDPTYIDRLQELPEDERKALLDGSWDVTVGTFFPQWDPKKHIIEHYVPDMHDRLFIAVDWGTSKPFSVGWFALTTENKIIMYREWYGIKGNMPDVGLDMLAVDVAEIIGKKTPVEEKIKYLVLDTACWIHTGTGESIFEQMQKRLRKYDIFIITAKKERINGWENMKAWLGGRNKEGKPLFQVTKECRHFIRTIADMLYDNKGVDMNSKLEDHCIDMVRYLLASRPYRSLHRENSRFPEGTYGEMLEKTGGLD